MKIIEKDGKSTSAIISSFMKEFDLKLEDFKFDVIEEGSSGFLHLFGTKPTKIQFHLPDIEDYLRIFIEQILRLMNLDFKEIKIWEENNIYFINIFSSENAGFLIGKSAKLLDSLQHLVKQMINKKMKKQISLQLDVENYRTRRKKILTTKVNEIIRRVRKLQKSITLDPFTSAERRIVHKLIETQKDIKTMTVGEGEQKRIVIFPDGKFSNRSKQNNKTKNFNGKPN